MSERVFVKLYKDGDNMGIETNATKPDEFWLAFSSHFAELIEDQRFQNDWDFQLSYWLPQAHEIANKLKGYKCHGVQEERLLRCGYASWTEDWEVRTNGEMVKTFVDKNGNEFRVRSGELRQVSPGPGSPGEAELAEHKAILDEARAEADEQEDVPV